ncbi:DUF1189 domain-containing protein, partial [Candidatus Woesearchaeota archaeon]|nr:DUF1189 domain-containing protein [Candidatus Woesearchaeota archaeon]
LSKTFAVDDYDQLAEQKVGTSLSYFLKIMLLGPILRFIFSIPALAKIQASAEGALSKFGTLKLSLNYSQKEPVVFFEGDSSKQITIDLNSNATKAGSSKILITNHSIINKNIIGSSETDLLGFSDILSHKESYKNILTMFMVLMIPSLFVIAYVAFALKFIIGIIAVSFIGFIVARVIRFEIGYLHCFNAAMYASPVAILFPMILFPYSVQYGLFRFEWAGYAISLILFVLGMHSIGYFEKKPSREREIGKRKKYIEIK